MFADPWSKGPSNVIQIFLFPNLSPKILVCLMVCKIRNIVKKKQYKKMDNAQTATCTKSQQTAGRQKSGHTWSWACRSIRSRPPLLSRTPLHCNISATHAARRSWAEKDFCWFNWHAACRDVSLQPFFLFGFPPRSFRNVLVKYIKAWKSINLGHHHFSIKPVPVHAIKAYSRVEVKLHLFCSTFTARYLNPRGC
jgi:hypothetical protein